MRSIITYETQHGSAKKTARILAEALGVKYINVDTPFEAEDLSEIDVLIMVFNFRGPYTAQLTKLFLERVKEQMRHKDLILVGEGLFSMKEFPVVAEGIRQLCPCRSMHTWFVKGQLRVATLTPEEQALLTKFSAITGMTITDMGEFSEAEAGAVAAEVKRTIEALPAPTAAVQQETKWVCPRCGYTQTGANPPDKCPLCGAPASEFVAG